MTRRHRLAVVLAAVSAAAFAAEGLAAERAGPRVAAAERTGRSAPARGLGPDARPVVTFRAPADLPGAARSNPPLRREVPGLRPDADGALAKTVGGGRNAPAPAGASFDGLSSADNASVLGFRVLPPDTNHDVGPAHVVETTNLLVQVFAKDGDELTAPFRMSTLFAPLGGICSTHDDGDPVVLYDPLGDRWLLSQFAFETTGPLKDVTHECIAVSTSGDPTGDWYLYDFLGPNTDVFGDYPHLGVWPDGYYMTTNQFDGFFVGGGVFAFERERMLVGDPEARVVYIDLGDPTIGGMLPADFDGLRAPPPGTPNPFAYFIASEFGDASDGLRIYDFAVDWADPESSTFTERAESPLAVAAFNPISASGRNDIVQSGATCSTALDAIGDRLMHRLQYRNSGGSETLTTSHTVNANGITTCNAAGATYQAGVRIYQLARTAGAANPFTIVQQMTHAPADGVSRWMGSAATDHEDNLAVGYSASSVAVFPGVRYTGRLAGAPAGTLQAEATLVAGSGVQTHTSGRWGDYSSLAVDPADDCTFWYSQQYYTAASQATSPAGWLTRIGNFKHAECSASTRGALEVTVTACAGGAELPGAVVTATGGFLRVADAEGLASFDAMAPGSYDIVAASGPDSSDAESASVVAGQTTELEVCIGTGDLIFEDDFESSDACEWSDSQGAPPCP